MFDIFAESREQARSEAIPWAELEGKRVLITGATASSASPALACCWNATASAWGRRSAFSAW